MHGLRAVLERRFDRSDFKGISVGIQGLGAVGWGVAERLHAAGARLTVADVRDEATARAALSFGAVIASPNDIHRADVDIYCPCALGGVINEESIPAIRAKAVAGAANNQLSSPEAGVALAAHGILFAPDYVINAGGIISGLAEATKMPGRETIVTVPLEENLARIYDRLGQIFDRATAEGKTPEFVAEQVARELIGRSRKPGDV
jgi:leucine dehydrogenase